jgi:glycosyltransferase involved in cell wall biosynthesis
MLLEAAAHLRDQGVDADYWIIGDGPVRDDIARRIDELQLGNCVRMFGQRNDVEAAYEVMDIVVLTSDSEGCPNALLEAMRASLPIISTQCTSLDHVIAEGVNGFVVPVGGVRELAERLKVLIHDASLRRQFGAASRSMVEKTFSMPVAVRHLEQTYLHFLKQGMVKHASLRRKLANLDVL